MPLVFIALQGTPAMLGLCIGFLVCSIIAYIADVDRADNSGRCVHNRVRSAAPCEPLFLEAF